jgi:archaellum component FlaC
MILKLVGMPSYRGFDGNVEIHVEQNEIIQVSEEKAAQLLNDFPEVWEKVDKIKKKAKEVEEPVKEAKKPVEKTEKPVSDKK